MLAGALTKDVKIRIQSSAACFRDLSNCRVDLPFIIMLHKEKQGVLVCLLCLEETVRGLLVWNQETLTGIFNKTG